MKRSCRRSSRLSLRAGKGMGFREHQHHTLDPKMQRSVPSAFTGLGNESHIHRSLLDRSPVRARGALDDLDRYTSMVLAEAFEQISQENERHADADGKLTMLAPPQCIRTFHGASQMVEPERRFLQEPIARRGGPNAGVIAFKDICADAVFEASDTPANCRLLDIKGGRGAAKTAVLS